MAYLPGTKTSAILQHKEEKNGRKKAAFCQKFMIFNKSQNIVRQAQGGDQKTYCEAVYIIFRGEQISSAFMLRLLQESVVFYMLPFFKQMCMFYCCLNEQCRLLIVQGIGTWHGGADLLNSFISAMAWIREAAVRELFIRLLLRTK